MSELMKIQPFIQSYVQAVSSILGSDVTIVDNELRRVGGTGIYESQIGKEVAHSAFFQSILKSRKPGIIKDARQEQVCINCDRRDSCQEMANIAFPILRDGSVVGVIAVIAFDQRQRACLLEDHGKLEEFLKYMSALVESKLISEERNQNLAHQITQVTEHQNKENSFNQIIGQNSKFLEAIKLAQKISPSESTVMLRGESGTGKELFAKAIHSASPRRNQIITTVNCAAIPENLVESELFGYEEGAFTGANRKGHIGKFELADKSTIFLDEIGDMPVLAQTKLLRVLQEQRVERLGGKKPIPINVRVICATNQDLEKMVKKGTFREDLYYRLNVIPIHIPPLRERKDDILALLWHFIHHYNTAIGKELSRFTRDAEQFLIDYSWPGNIRELRNIAEYLVNIAEHPCVSVSDLPDHLLIRANHPHNTLEGLLCEYEKKIILSLTRNKRTVEEKLQVAEHLKISPATLYRKLKKYQDSEKSQS